MTIADGMSALSEHILLIVFVIIPVLISWLDLQLGSLCIPKSSNLSKFIMLLSTLFRLVTVGLRHSGHVIPFFAYIRGKMIAMTRN